MGAIGQQSTSGATVTVTWEWRLLVPSRITAVVTPHSSATHTSRPPQLRGNSETRREGLPDATVPFPGVEGACHNSPYWHPEEWPKTRHNSNYGNGFGEATSGVDRGRCDVCTQISTLHSSSVISFVLFYRRVPYARFLRPSHPPNCI
jgi:hypothetical protein